MNNVLKSLAWLLKADWEQTVQYLQNPWEKLSPKKVWDALINMENMTEDIKEIEAEYILNPNEELLKMCI